MDEFDDFIRKVDDVQAAIEKMQSGELNPEEVKIAGLETEEDKRRKAVQKKRVDDKLRQEQIKKESEKWWKSAEVLYGPRKMEKQNLDESQAHSKIDKCGDEKSLDAPEKYNLDYSKWDKWVPEDPATQEEKRQMEIDEEKKKNEEFERLNPEFCNQFKQDQVSRAQKQTEKEAQANKHKLKGNKLFAKKDYGGACAEYMAGLHLCPFLVPLLTNIAQAHMKMESWEQGIDFCDRALHVDGGNAKALLRRGKCREMVGRGRYAALCLSHSLASPTHSQHDRPNQEANQTGGEGGGKGKGKGKVASGVDGEDEGGGSASFDVLSPLSVLSELEVALADYDNAVALLDRERDTQNENIKENEASVSDCTDESGKSKNRSKGNQAGQVLAPNANANGLAGLAGHVGQSGALLCDAGRQRSNLVLLIDEINVSLLLLEQTDAPAPAPASTAKHDDTASTIATSPAIDAKQDSANAVSDEAQTNEEKDKDEEKEEEEGKGKGSPSSSSGVLAPSSSPTPTPTPTPPTCSTSSSPSSSPFSSLSSSSSSFSSLQDRLRLIEQLKEIFPLPLPLALAHPCPYPDPDNSDHTLTPDAIRICERVCNELFSNNSTSTFTSGLPLPLSKVSGVYFRSCGAYSHLAQYLYAQLGSASPSGGGGGGGGGSWLVGVHMAVKIIAYGCGCGCKDDDKDKGEGEGGEIGDRANFYYPIPITPIHGSTGNDGDMVFLDLLLFVLEKIRLSLRLRPSMSDGSNNDGDVGGGVVEPLSLVTLPASTFCVYFNLVSMVANVLKNAVKTVLTNDNPIKSKTKSSKTGDGFLSVARLLSELSRHVSAIVQTTASDVLVGGSPSHSSGSGSGSGLEDAPLSLSLSLPLSLSFGLEGWRVVGKVARLYSLFTSGRASGSSAAKAQDQEQVRQKASAWSAMMAVAVRQNEECSTSSSSGSGSDECTLSRSLSHSHSPVLFFSFCVTHLLRQLPSVMMMALALATTGSDIAKDKNAKDNKGGTDTDVDAAVSGTLSDVFVSLTNLMQVPAYRKDLTLTLTLTRPTSTYTYTSTYTCTDGKGEAGRENKTMPLLPSPSPSPPPSLSLSLFDVVSFLFEGDTYKRLDEESLKLASSLRTLEQNGKQSHELDTAASSSSSSSSSSSVFRFLLHQPLMEAIKKEMEARREEARKGQGGKERREGRKEREEELQAKFASMLQTIAHGSSNGNTSNTSNSNTNSSVGDSSVGVGVEVEVEVLVEVLVGRVVSALDVAKALIRPHLLALMLNVSNQTQFQTQSQHQSQQVDNVFVFANGVREEICRSGIFDACLKIVLAASSSSSGGEHSKCCCFDMLLLSRAGTLVGRIANTNTNTNTSTRISSSNTPSPSPSPTPSPSPSPSPSPVLSAQRRLRSAAVLKRLIERLVAHIKLFENEGRGDGKGNGKGNGNGNGKGGGKGGGGGNSGKDKDIDGGGGGGGRGDGEFLANSRKFLLSLVTCLAVGLSASSDSTSGSGGSINNDNDAIIKEMLWRESETHSKTQHHRTASAVDPPPQVLPLPLPLPLPLGSLLVRYLLLLLPVPRTDVDKRTVTAETVTLMPKRGRGHVLSLLMLGDGGDFSSVTTPSTAVAVATAVATGQRHRERDFSLRHIYANALKVLICVRRLLPPPPPPPSPAVPSSSSSSSSSSPSLASFLSVYGASQGTEKLICLLANANPAAAATTVPGGDKELGNGNAKEGEEWRVVRKNASVLVAKMCQLSPDVKKRTCELRGLEILLQLSRTNEI